MDYELLRGLSDEDRRAVLATATRRRFRRGEVLFHEGDPGDTFHQIAKGHVAIRVSTPSGDVGTLAVLGLGEGFGEQCLLDPHARRTATAVAIEATETLVLTRDQFADLRARHHTVDDLLLVHLARQVRRLSEQMIEALYLSADKRVLRRLLDAHLLFDGDVVPLTQEDLATMAGTTRPTANRVLQRAADDGMVVLGRGKVEVLDRDALASRAR
jgi:CRP/FNR family cyclic AMP-dependent transcriptional regulator